MTKHTLYAHTSLATIFLVLILNNLLSISILKISFEGILSIPIWQEYSGLTDYVNAVAMMYNLHEKIAEGSSGELVCMLEHAPVYTGGTSATKKDLINTGEIPTHLTSRGGQWTYHGPGQRVYWPLLDLSSRQKDVRKYVYDLESWIIETLNCFSIQGQRRDGLPGVWVRRIDINKPERIDKIAALGVRISKWITMHGVAININPDLSAFDGIVPCGVNDGGVTSFADLGQMVSMAELDMAAKKCFKNVF